MTRNSSRVVVLAGVLALVFVVGLVVAPRGVPFFGDSRVATLSTVNWSRERCPDHLDGSTAALPPGTEVRCAKIRVPKDYDKPGLDGFELLVSKVSRGTTANRVLFTNPGGPGGEGVSLPIELAWRQPKFLDSHVLIGIDPRGSGGSSSIQQCAKPAYPTDSGAESDTEWAVTEIAAERTANETCARQHPDAQYLSTELIARDMEHVRQSLAPVSDRIDFYGASYGTYLGRYYQYFFPEHSGRFVLDSSMDFTASWSAQRNAQNTAFEQRFRTQFLPWVARGDARWSLGASLKEVEASYVEIRKAFQLGWFDVVGLDPGYLSDVVTKSLYDASAGFERLAKALSEAGKLVREHKSRLEREGLAPEDSDYRAQAGEVGRTFEAIVPRGTPGEAFNDTMFRAVRCNDDGPPADDGTLVTERVKEITQMRAPDTLLQMAFPNDCAGWPYPNGRLPRLTGKAVNGADLPDALMVHAEFDGPTPLEGAVAAHRADGHTRLVTVHGEGDHGVYISARPTARVQQVVNEYLIDGKGLPRDETVQAVPLPGESKVYRTERGGETVAQKPGKAGAVPQH